MLGLENVKITKLDNVEKIIEMKYGKEDGEETATYTLKAGKCSVSKSFWDLIQIEGENKKGEQHVYWQGIASKAEKINGVWVFEYQNEKRCFRLDRFKDTKSGQIRAKIVFKK